MEESKKNFPSISLMDLWTVFRRCWVVSLIVALLAGGGTAFYLYKTHTDVYTATATLFVLRETKKEYTETADVSIANNLIYDVADTVTSNDVLEAVQAISGTTRSTRSLASMIRIAEISDETPTHIVRIRVTSSDPLEAKLLGEALVTCTCDKMSDLFNGEKYVKPYDAVKLPTSPSNPINKRAILVASAASAVLCYLAFLLQHIMDGRIGDEITLKRELDVSLLGEIPNADDARHIHKKASRYSTYAAAKKDGENA